MKDPDILNTVYGDLAQVSLDYKAGKISEEEFTQRRAELERTLRAMEGTATPYPSNREDYPAKGDPSFKYDPKKLAQIQPYARGSKKVGVAKGFGPRHAENAKEGDDLTQVNTDSVPAMLTPREAVLNRNAAELAGRGNIEQLNQEGNVLAKKGVDLAAKGQASVPKVKVPVSKAVASGNVLKYVLPGELRREAAAGLPKLAGGTKNMKSKPKKMQSGSPYAQGFEKMQGFQGGGQVNRRFNPAADAGGYYGATDPVAGGPVPGGVPTQGRPMPVQRGRPDPFARPGVPPVSPNPVPPIQSIYSTSGGGEPGPYVPPVTPVDPKGVGGGMYGDPGYNAIRGGVPGSYGVPGPGTDPLGGGFYPPGQGLRGTGSGLRGYAGGTEEVPGGIGTPNPSKAYDPREVDFKAPDISGFLQAIHAEAKKQGISSSQMGQIAQSITGGLGRGAYGGDLSSAYGAAGSPSPVYGESGYPSAIPLGGYQGGISDIGYPPFLMPDAEYHADKGSSWVGPYDPAFLVQRYARGTANVPFR
jgi:hypothetical protein